MRKFWLVSAIYVTSVGAAWSGTPCEEVKANIQAKIKAKGVETFTLDAIPAEEVGTEAKVVGSCEGGAKKIVYTRG